MSNKLIKSGLALAIASAITATANAGTMTVATSIAIGSEASTRTNGVSANVGAAANDGNTIKYLPGTTLGNQDVVTFTIANGTFTTGPYILVDAVNSAAIPSNLLNASANQAGGATISFRLTNGSGYDATSDGRMILVSGTVGTLDDINLNVANVAACNGCVTIAAQTQNSVGSLTIDTAPAVEMADIRQEFSASVSSTVDASKTVDVARARLLFNDGSSDARFGVKFEELSGAAGLSTDGTRDVALVAADAVRFTLSGDMSGIASITGDGNNAFTIDTANNTATLTQAAVAGGSSITTASQVYPVTIVVDETTALEARTYSVTTELVLADEADQTLVTNGQVSQWTVNGMSARVSHFSLNVTDFISWLKITNSGSTAADIEVGGTYTLGDGTSMTVNATLVKAVAANSVTTVSEAEMLTALGISGTSEIVDVSLVVEVAGVADNIQIHAEKRASDERVVVPVLYDNSNTSTRTFFQ